MEPAQQAYIAKDIQLSKIIHKGDPENQALNGKIIFFTTCKGSAKHEEKHNKTGETIKSAVYGSFDGIITTYAIISAAVGANLSTGVIIILGVSSVISDGLSMAIGDYLSSKSEKDYYLQEKQREQWEVDNNPEGEKKEMLELYQAKGLEQEDAHTVAEVLSRNPKAWVEVMMSEELGLQLEEENPLKNAIVTFVAFVIFGFLPLLPYIIGLIAKKDQGLIAASTVLAGSEMFAIGVAKSFFSYRQWWASGLESLIVGAAVAAATFFIGYLFEGVSF